MCQIYWHLVVSSQIDTNKNNPCLTLPYAGRIKFDKRERLHLEPVIGLSTLDYRRNMAEKKTYSKLLKAPVLISGEYTLIKT